MAYHDNEYKPDSPKKITEKKEELIVPPNFISMPSVEKVQPEIIPEQTVEQSIQEQLIKQIEAETRIIKPTVLSSKRSAFLNKGVKERSKRSASLNKQEYIELNDNLPQRNITSSPEGIVMPSTAEHCWGFSSIYASGAWHTPAVPWMGVQSPTINNNYGPWGVYGLPGVPGPPPDSGSPLWVSTFANDPVFRQAASDAFYNFVVSNVGPISIGDTVILEIQDPTQYMSSITIGVPGNVGMTGKYCFKYEGVQTDWTHTWCHYGVPTQIGHSHVIDCPVSQSCSCGCGDDCQGVILTGYEVGDPGDGPDSGFFYYDHDANTYTQLSGATGFRHDVARWDDKLYAKGYTSGAGLNIIQEYQIDTANCSVTWLRDILLEDYTGFDTGNVGGWIDVGNAMDMKDANTIICGTVGAFSGLGAPWTGLSLIEVDISGSAGIATNVGFPASHSSYPNPCEYKAVDVMYMQDTDQYLVSMTRQDNLPPCNTAPSKILRLFSLSGQLLEECTSVSGLGLYRTHPNGDIFVTGGAGSTDIHAVTFGPLTVGPAIQNTGLGAINGAAYNPNVNCYPATGECYDVGDIGPEGGIIFSVPGHNLNTSAYTYYEVAQDDIAIAGTPQGNPAFPLFGPAGFNQVCGEDTFLSMTFNTYVGVSQGGSVGGSVNINDNVIEIDTSYVTNSQFLAAINNGSISVGTMVNGDPTGPYMPVPNIFPTSSTPLVTPGPAITHIVPLGQSTDPNVITLIFNELIIANAPSPWTGGLIDVRFYYLATAPGWSLTGAEWGVHNKPFTQTSLDFDTGHINTDSIHNYPSSPGIHPWLDTHDIAATLSKQHGSTNDWFLPSYWEFREMVDNVGSHPLLGLNTSTQNSQNYYWTSSNRLLPNAQLPDADKYAWAYNNHTDDLELAYRCHALSVRPIRRFECVPDPCKDNSIPNLCGCVQYNYRDGHCGTVEGSFCSGCNDGSGGPVSATDWTTTTGGQHPGSTVNGGDSVMGGPTLHIQMNSWDVMSNQYTQADFLGMSIVKISLWDVNYNFMGIWQYELGGSGGASDVVGFPGSNNPNFGSYDNPGPATRGAVYFHNPQHLEGDYPTIWYGGNGSSTGIFMKLEWDGAVGYETACNSTIFGNPHPHNTPGNEEDWPFYCGPLYDGTTDGTFSGLSRVIPRYATTQPNDIQGNPITVHPTALLANPNFNMSFWPPTATPTDILSTGACEFCDYDIGDVGPSGGIIVAKPNSPNSTYNASNWYFGSGGGWASLDTGSNDSDYYYELSPVDLNTPYSTGIPPNAEWGNFEIISGIDLTSVVDNGGILSVDALNNGEINTTDLMTTNPGANMMFCPGGVFPPCIPPAPELCNSYSLNGYNDWFLPSVHEWGFVRNNIPSISTSSNYRDNLYWTSNFWDISVLGNNDPVIPNPYFPFTYTLMDNILPGSNDGTYSEFNALAVDVNTPAVSIPELCSTPSCAIQFPGFTEAFYWHMMQAGLGGTPQGGAGYPEFYLAYHAVRWEPVKVRAMRRFECPVIPPSPIYGCTNPIATNYDPLANTDDGSCIYTPTGTAPCFSVCGIENNGSWGSGWNWTGPIAMENNPLGYTSPPFGNAYPLPPQDFTAFYDWVLNSIPTLVPGDTFIIDMPYVACYAPTWDCWEYSYQYLSPNLGYLTTVTIVTGYSAMCLKYEGQQSYTIQDPLSTPLYFTNEGDPVPTITPSSCCVSSPIAGGSLARIGSVEPQDGTIDSVNYLR